QPCRHPRPHLGRRAYARPARPAIQRAPPPPASLVALAPAVSTSAPATGCPAPAATIVPSMVAARAPPDLAPDPAIEPTEMTAAASHPRMDAFYAPRCE